MKKRKQLSRLNIATALESWKPCGRDLELQSILIKIRLGCKLLEIVREPPRKYERSRSIGELQCGNVEYSRVQESSNVENCRQIQTLSRVHESPRKV